MAGRRNSTNGRQSGLNSGTYQHSGSKFRSKQTAGAVGSNDAPSIATHTDSDNTTKSAIRRPRLASRLPASATAIARDAGSDANRKNRGPQNQPPYHAHHLA